MDMLGHKQADPTPIVIVWSIKLASGLSRALVCTTGQNSLILGFIASGRCRNHSREVKLYKVAGDNQSADIFTKSLPRSSDDL